jgi:inosine-uridine nucleoside N-ribohydrolase
VHTASRHAENVHGDDGLGGVRLPAPTGTLDPRHAVDRLTEVLAGGPVTLVATGPLTNIALLYALRPELLSNVEHLVVMGGSIGVGNVNPAAEFNIWFDPEAAQRVLGAPAVRTTMVGLDVTMRTTLSAGRLDAVRATGPIGQQVAAGLDFYEQRYLRMLGRSVIPVHDAVAVVAATRPDLVTTRPAAVTVDTGYGPSRGNTLVDFAAPAPDVEVAVDADKDAVLAYILDRIASLENSAASGPT